jgi:hypothetical protein
MRAGRVLQDRERWRIQNRRRRGEPREGTENINVLLEWHEVYAKTIAVFAEPLAASSV